MPPWHECNIALSSPERAKEEPAVPAKILFTNTSAEIVEDAREMAPATFDLIVVAAAGGHFGWCRQCGA